MRTTDGRQVIGRIFELYDTHGLPLDMIFDVMKTRHIQPDLFGFIQDANAAGWKFRTTYTRLREAILDVYGRTYWLEVLKRLDLVLSGVSSVARSAP